MQTQTFVPEAPVSAFDLDSYIAQMQRDLEEICGDHNAATTSNFLPAPKLEQSFPIEMTQESRKRKRLPRMTDAMRLDIQTRFDAGEPLEEITASYAGRASDITVYRVAKRIQTKDYVASKVVEVIAEPVEATPEPAVESEVTQSEVTQPVMELTPAAVETTPIAVEPEEDSIEWFLQHMPAVHVVYSES